MKKLFLLLFVLFILWKGEAQTRYAYKDIYGRSNDTLIVFGNLELCLSFDSKNGEIVTARDSRSGIRWQSGCERPDLDANIDGVWILQQQGARLAAHSWRKEGGCVRLALNLAIRPGKDSSPAYRITLYYELSPGSGDFRRWAMLRSAAGADGDAARTENLLKNK